MILFNAALVGAYWERLLALQLEQRRVAGREPPSEQRSEEQSGYWEVQPLHLHPHRAPITATQPTDLLLSDIRATRSRAMDTQATRDTPLTPVLRAMDTQATRDSPLTPVHRAMDTRAARHTLLPTPVPVMEIPSLATPAIALRGTGRLEPSTLSSLLAEFRPKLHLQSSPLVRGEGKRFRKIALPAEKRATLDRSSGKRTGAPVSIMRPASVHSPWRQARAGVISLCDPPNQGMPCESPQ
jgi:hypothetical protein